MDISNFKTAGTLLSQGKNKAIVTTVGVTGIGKFIFDIPSTTNTSMTSRITSYAIAEGEIVSDNVVNDTPDIALEGYFGTYSMVDPLALFNMPTQFLGQKLASLGSVGHLSSAQRRGLNKLTQQTDAIASRLSNATSSLQSTMTLLTLSTADTRASKAFDILSNLRDAKVTFAVDSNTRRYNKCLITSLGLSSDELTGIHTLRVNFKQIKTTSIAVVKEKSQIEENKNKVQDAKSALQGATASIKDFSNKATTKFF